MSSLHKIYSDPTTPHSGACTYIQNSTFFEWSEVLYIIVCTKLFKDKCMHQYTKHIYVKLPVNFEILRQKLKNMPSMVILKDAIHIKTRLTRQVYHGPRE